ncbi:MAG: hypothetical protein QG574_913 [Cyanobacteriota bacterium erpe_2018_sw_21hr_WHONDRS-SW48-000092_B_bin.40]|nr:hypothetical protein [Cyanobacteriota bacterium erpe_2018_sw_21hr_WHONDRS-SW48-000092_B_bin.40]
MYDSSSTTDNAVSPPEIALSNDHLRDEIDTDSIYAVPADSSQATQQLVDAGQVPALELVSATDSQAFNNMISTDGLTVFNSPGRGQRDYFADVDGLDDPGIFWNGTDGAITKSGIDSYIAQADSAAPRRSINPGQEEFVDSLRKFSENWDSPEMTPYKDTLDSMTRESFAAGLESLSARQEAAVTADEAPTAEATSAEATDTSGVPAEFVPPVLTGDDLATTPADVPADVSAGVSQDAVLEEPAEVVVGPVDVPAAAPVDAVPQETTDVPIESTSDARTGPVDVPAESTSDVPSTGPVDVPADVPVDGSVDPDSSVPSDSAVEPAATLSLSDDAAQLSLVQLGEGPYQVAERLLSAGDSPTNQTEIMALVRAMQAQYREEYPEDPNLASLKVNHQFLTPEKVDALLSSISDPALRDSIAAKILKPAETETIDPSGADSGADSATGETDSTSQETSTVSDQLRAVGEREAFNNMIASDGLNVFATPVDSADYLSEVDGADSLEGITDGAITKSEIDSFISASVASNDMSTTSGDPARDAFVESIRKISENWDNPEMSPYKDAQGAITRESFAAGMESLPQRQEQVAAEKDALALPAYEGADQPYAEDTTDVVSEHIEANQPEAIQPAAEVPLQSLPQEIADLAQVQKGEGPYQIAARILASGGTAAGNSEVTALMRALQAQYRLDNPDDATLAGLRQGYPLLTAENVDSVLSNITDSQMRQRIEAKLFPQDSES